MRKRNIRLLVSKNIIFITLIISMSFIGVGYAEWNDSLIIDLYIKTGLIVRNFDVDTYKSYDDGDLYFTISDEGDKLIIKGKVYPTFNEDMTINLVDSGSLPSVITDIQFEDNDISTLKSPASKQRAAIFNLNNKKMDSFNININPNVNKESMRLLNIVNFESKDEISSLENELADLENEINVYNNIEKRSFKYTISYEFGKGIWEKDLKVEGYIDVIPDPKVLNNMESKLADLGNQINAKYEAQKILEEQQRLIEEQRLSEEQKKLEQGNIEQKPQEQNEDKNENQDSYIKEDNNPISVPETEENIDDSAEEIVSESEETSNESKNVNTDNHEIEEDNGIEQISENPDLKDNSEETSNEQKEKKDLSEESSEDENNETN